ncbi:hypothetical protein Tco_0487833 [Tanacetum coccineum]
MLQICPKLPGQQFVDPPFEEEILTFMRELGYPGNIKLLSDVKVDILPQPWRTFGTIINKCLSGKVTGINSLRLSRAQILWGLYHQQKVDYAYLLWEDLVFQIENKESQKNKYIFIPQHEVVQKYGAILPDNLTTQAMKESEAYKTYYAFATRKVIPKPKYVRRTTKEKTVQAPKASSGKRIKSATKVTRSGKKKQLAEGLETLSEIALTEAEQMKLAIERSKTQLYSSQPSSSGAHEGTGVTPGVPDVPTYGSDDEKISWKSSDEEDDDDEANIGKDEDDDDQDDDDNADYDDDDERTESDNDGDDFVHPKFSIHDEKDKEEDSFDPRVQTLSHVESTDDEDSDEEIQGVNVKGDKQDEEETNEEVEANELYKDVNINSSSVSSGFVSNMLNPSPDTGINSIFNLNTELTSLVDVPVTAIAEPPLLSTHEAVKTAVQLQSERLRDEAQAENADFINKLDDNIKKIIKNQVKEQVKAQVSKILPKIEKTVNEQLEAEILTHKMESNKSIHRSNEQKNLYKALVDAYESDKLILDTYGDTVSFKRRRDDEDKDEEPSARSNRGSKRRRAGKEPESTSAPKEKTSKASGKSTEGSKSHHKSAGESTQAEEPINTAKDLKEPAHQEFKIGVTEDQPDEETSQHPDWFQKPTRPPTLDRDWNKTLPDAHGLVQPWISSLAQMEGPHESFNELMDTPLDFSAFVMNRLKVDTLTPELLTGSTFKLMKGSCKSLPLPLIPNSRGRQVIPFDHFINNDLTYLSGGDSSRKYTTSVTKTKAADYGHIKWIEDLVPNTMWSQVPVDYDKHALWGISYWGRKRQQFYAFVVNRESARDVYSKRRIIAVTKLEIVEWQNYKHLDWITVRRDDDKLYKFKEGDLKRLRIQDIEYMLLLLVQGKLTNLTVEEFFTFNVSLRMFTISIVIQRRMEDLQLGVESYQKKLNLTKPNTYRSDLKRREAYSAYSNPRGFIYQNKDKKNRLMRIDELHKFSDGTLNDVQTALNDRLKGIQMKYLPQTIWRQSDRDKAGAMIQAIDKQLKTRRIMRSLERFVVGRPYEGDFRLLQRTI